MPFGYYTDYLKVYGGMVDVCRKCILTNNFKVLSYAIVVNEHIHVDSLLLITFHFNSYFAGISTYSKLYACRIKYEIYNNQQN